MDNTVTIVLPAGPDEDLAWNEEFEKARQAAGQGKNLLWEFDWGRFSGRFTEEPVLAAQMIALQEWTKRFAPLFSACTAGVIIYQGPICPTLNDEGKERYQAWLEGRDDIPLYKRNYSNTLLFEYLHRLGSILPDTVTIVANLDVSAIENPAEQAFLLSTPTHLQLKIFGAKIVSETEASRGVCLPSEEYYSLSAMEKLEALLRKFHDEGHTYRIVPEKLLNEQWDGLDQLYVVESLLTKQGKRMLQGFIAAGGEVVAF